MNLIANGRSVGRQAARIAILSSRYDQVAAFVLLHVRSDVFVAALSAERRMREIMQVLEFLAKLGLDIPGKTYKNPRPKMNMSITFCRLGSCKDLMIGRGRIHVPKSVAMFMQAGA